MKFAHHEVRILLIDNEVGLWYPSPVVLFEEIDKLLAPCAAFKIRFLKLLWIIIDYINSQVVHVLWFDTVLARSNHGQQVAYRINGSERLEAV